MITSFAPHLLDVEFPEHDGYPRKLSAEDTPDALKCAAADAARDFPEHLWIEPSRWAEVAEENDRYHTWPLDYLDRFTNQDPTHECTCHALRVCAEGARNRARRIQLGPPEPHRVTPQPPNSASVWLSPLSVYAEANPQQWGGASVRGVLEIACRRGVLPSTKQPRSYRIPHALHDTAGKGNASCASGPWTPLSKFPAGWEATAKHFRPREVIFPTCWEHIVCLVLHGWFVGVGRSGHAIPYGRWQPEDRVLAYPDSYDVIRYDSVRLIQRAVGSAYAIVSMTTPDDWEQPCGA